MDKTCALCFDTFTATVGQQVYCATCAVEARKLRQAGYNAKFDPGRQRSGKCAARPCVFCGKSFQRGEGCKFCTADCRLAYNSAWRENAARNKPKVQKAEKAPRPTKPEEPKSIYRCAVCGKDFTPEHGGRKTYCTRRCQRVARQRRAHETDITKQPHYRKACMLGVACTSVSAKAVFTRDGWQCKHCGQPTPMALRGTVDSRAPELDHILPMNKTWLGAHVQHNCQCLCRGCNGAKGGVSAGTWGQLQAAEPALRGQPMDVLAYYRAAVCVPNGVACASL